MSVVDGDIMEKTRSVLVILDRRGRDRGVEKVIRRSEALIMCRLS